jgi:hypothetical protein
MVAMVVGGGNMILRLPIVVELILCKESITWEAKVVDAWKKQQCQWW